MTAGILWVTLVGLGLSHPQPLETRLTDDEKNTDAAKTYSMTRGEPRQPSEMSFPSSFPRSQHLTYRKNGQISKDCHSRGGGSDSTNSGRPQHKKRPATSYHRHPKRMRIGNHKLVLNHENDTDGSSVGEASRAVSANNHMKKLGNHKLVARGPTTSTTAMSMPEATDGSTSNGASTHQKMITDGLNNSQSTASTNEPPPHLTSEHHRPNTIRRVGATNRITSSKSTVETTDKNPPENWKKLGRNKIVMRHPTEQPPRRREDAPRHTNRQCQSSGPSSFSWKKKPDPSAPICTFFQRKGMCLNPDCKFVHIKVNARATRQQEEEQKQQRSRKKRPHYR